MKTKQTLEQYFQNGATIGIGSRVKNDTDTYIVAQVASCQIVLVNADSGNRWGEATPVKNPCKITKSEIETVIQSLAYNIPLNKWTVAKIYKEKY